jgi:hypothetical protein
MLQGEEHQSLNFLSNMFEGDKITEDFWAGCVTCLVKFDVHMGFISNASRKYTPLES